MTKNHSTFFSFFPFAIGILAGLLTLSCSDSETENGTDTNSNTDLEFDSSSDTHTHVYSDSDSNLDTGSHSDAGTSGDTSTDTHTVTEKDTGSDIDSNTASDSDTDIASGTDSDTDTDTNPGVKQIVGYFAQWGIYARSYMVKNIVTSGSAEKLTIINYAFGNVVNSLCSVGISQAGVGDAWADYQKGFTAEESIDGVADPWDTPLKGNWNQLKKLKSLYPHIKIMISLGGWTWSSGFSDAALPENKSAFVDSCIDIYIRGNLPIDQGSATGGEGALAGVFDGIDIDWEYPAAEAAPGHIFRPEDTQNFTALLEEFRTQLDAIDSNLLLTVALPAGESKFKNIELGKIHGHLNFLNLMTYDYHGAWDASGPTNFMANLYPAPGDPSDPDSSYSGDFTVNAYIDAGVPQKKIILGVPFYGRGWTGVNQQNNGLFQSATGPAPGTYEAGIEDYKVLKALGYPEYTDSDAKASWFFDGTTFWTYDSPPIIGDKMSYVKQKGLGGAMVWELDGDTPDGELINAVYNGLQ